MYIHVHTYTCTVTHAHIIIHTQLSLSLSLSLSPPPSLSHTHTHTRTCDVYYVLTGDTNKPVKQFHSLAMASSLIIKNWSILWCRQSADLDAHLPDHQRNRSWGIQFRQLLWLSSSSHSSSSCSHPWLVVGLGIKAVLTSVCNPPSTPHPPATPSQSTR